MGAPRRVTLGEGRGLPAMKGWVCTGYSPPEPRRKRERAREREKEREALPDRVHGMVTFTCNA